MVKRCIAAGCSKMYKNGVSLFQFSRNKVLHKQWTKEIQKTRTKWQGPTNNSILCSEHFTTDCFEDNTAIAPTFGIKNKYASSLMLYQQCSTGTWYIPPVKLRHLKVHLQVLEYLFLQMVIQYNAREQHTRREKE